MCAISGFISYKGKVVDPDKLHRLFTKCVNRGRDSFGLVGHVHGKDVTYKTVGEYKEIPDNVVQELLNVPSIVISNHRAEPTTEYVEHKSSEDAQPFMGQSGRVWLAHNGTIANDKDLATKYGIESVIGKIDTYVLTQVLDKEINEGRIVDAKGIGDFIGSFVKGSYAIAAIIGEELLLINNYKPLYLNFQPEGIYFASLEGYLCFHCPERAKDNIMKLNPYSYTTFKLGELDENTPLHIETLKKEPNQKALVVCSGGLDSVTSLKVAVDRFGKENVTLLHFQYHCNAEPKEVESVRAVSKRLGVEVIFMPIDIFGSMITESPLLDGSGQFAEYDKGVEFAYEWVPARNTVMMALAFALAEAKGYGYIYLGNNLEESGAYPDNEMEFIESLRKLVPNVVADGYSLEIEQPVGNLMKHEIVQLGLDVNAPLDLTWSCYKAGDKHCGVCGPCRMRKIAFKMAGRDEVIEYEK